MMTGYVKRLLCRLPGLEGTSFEVTSTPTAEYNCAIWACKHEWALGERDVFWSHREGKGYYWPPEVERGPSVDCYMKAFETESFEACADGSLEAGTEKIAVFGDDDGFTHVARQLEDGTWTSKLGSDCDISHELQALVAKRSPRANYRYGSIAGYMRRPKIIFS